MNMKLSKAINSTHGKYLCQKLDTKLPGNTMVLAVMVAQIHHLEVCQLMNGDRHHIHCVQEFEGLDKNQALSRDPVQPALWLFFSKNFAVTESVLSLSSSVITWTTSFTIPMDRMAGQRYLVGAYSLLWSPANAGHCSDLPHHITPKPWSHRHRAWSPWWGRRR